MSQNKRMLTLIELLRRGRKRLLRGWTNTRRRGPPAGPCAAPATPSPSPGARPAPPGNDPLRGAADIGVRVGK